jgi:hypothetical protein
VEGKLSGKYETTGITINQSYDRKENDIALPRVLRRGLTSIGQPCKEYAGG